MTLLLLLNSPPPVLDSAQRLALLEFVLIPLSASSLDKCELPLQRALCCVHYCLLPSDRVYPLPSPSPIAFSPQATDSNFEMYSIRPPRVQSECARIVQRLTQHFRIECLRLLISDSSPRLLCLPTAFESEAKRRECE
ncbi:hypothetical protein Mp_8g11440 [Marchantia polymorpha subsp. ruderalis]|uniref:Uncharacterized protein n=1 Tax=Marchantia polymorpha TaxID=3197 RepID=A0A2R6XMF8_MARPO|nr:hypothetical protein MARPO_0008s0072 [Marchantia polymorpha]BBN19529.1 hypothetical protein Mp_8g11440 [Marchantia polymorpha subsp. ruderalis]|eukprot:PTQ47295.1 hypothetical protein MARPO_0008s0072 [Marchantia polymorpha]